MADLLVQGLLAPGQELEAPSLDLLTTLLEPSFPER
jgi:hypothetical protein